MRARQLRSASTDAERLLWNALRDRQLDGYKFRRQHPVAPYFADFACVEAGLIVELDGGQHVEPDMLVADQRRSAALKRHGLHVLRFDNLQALNERDAVLSVVLEWLQRRHPHPQPSPASGRGSRNR